MRKSTRVSSSVPVYLSEPLSHSPRVARLTNCRSILLSTTANFLRRNCAIVGLSPMRIGQPPGNARPDHAISADSATRLIALVLGIHAATDDPYGYTNRTAGPALRVDRDAPSPVIGRPAASMRGIRRAAS